MNSQYIQGLKVCTLIAPLIFKRLTQVTLESESYIDQIKYKVKQQWRPKLEKGFAKCTLYNLFLVQENRSISVLEH